jgi:hypothetical protein
VFALCVARAKVNAGVVVAVATEVVAIVSMFPALKDVTVPPELVAVADTLLPTTENVTVALLTKLTLGITAPLICTEEPEPTAVSIKIIF